ERIESGSEGTTKRTPGEQVVGTAMDREATSRAIWEFVGFPVKYERLLRESQAPADHGLMLDLAARADLSRRSLVLDADVASPAPPRHAFRAGLHDRAWALDPGGRQLQAPSDRLALLGP